MSERTPLPELLAALDQAARAVAPDQVPALLGELERIRTAALIRAVGAPQSPVAQEDTALDVAQAAQLLGVSPKTLANGAQTTYARLRLNTGARALRFSRARVLAFRESDPTRPTLAIAPRAGKGRR